jgi:UDP-N-acetylmuramate--alanine ligase
MNIYFCGIGGVGIGPLAEIALDAGYEVQGSDKNKGIVTSFLESRGVTISYDQSGSHLRSVHEQQPIDWFVYTAGIPENHPELVTAQSLGIRTSKRDELLQQIITDKNLKLIGITGTHGKTTTTAMMVWTLKQLGIPISYSVGATMQFGPSGHYDPASEYFVYECDEFDRNFLHFHPHLSIITSIDYDHPDIYATPDDYVQAFRQFIAQSDWTILWRRDANRVGDMPHTSILGDSDIPTITLAGQHNRHNAAQVIKAIERLGIHGDTVAAINAFPGTNRHFEKLATNLYSDYGHHPSEVASTLQWARELSSSVVLVYQPHQNVRQHELRSQYTDCFKLAETVYWLPTYLTREDPTLPVLTPDELSATVTNHDAIIVSEMDETLWQNIQKARDRGALVLVMGAGSIDGWIREKLANY